MLTLDSDEVWTLPMSNMVNVHEMDALQQIASSARCLPNARQLYLENLAQKFNNFTDSLEVRIVVFLEKRQYEENHVLILWVLQQVEERYAMVPRVGDQLRRRKHLGNFSLARVFRL